MNGMVSMRDYEGIQGFGISSPQAVEDLNKALTAGVQNPPQSGGSALRVESLEATLRVVTFTLGHIKMWRMIPKLPAFNTVEEYNRLTDYGADAGAFTNEGDLPESQDSTYERKAAYVKFLGTQREVSHPMTLVRPAHGNVIALETQNGAIWLVERLERALFQGRSDNISQEIDGILKQIYDGVGVANPNTDLYDATGVLHAGAETVIVDKRGGDILENDLEDGTNFIVQNYGVPTDLHLAPTAHKNISKQFYPRERVNLPLPGGDGRVGLAIKGFDSNAGPVNFQQNIFLRSGRNNGVKTAPTAPTSPKAPNPPTLSAAAAGADAKSMYSTADAGVYSFVVTAVNRFGESAPSAPVSVTFSGSDSSVLTITDAGGAYATTAYKVYRTKTAGLASSNAMLTTTVARQGATSTYTDRNWFIPGTSVAYMMQNNIQNFAVRQLAPMMKIPLATVAASIRWMQLLYLTLIMYTPKKNFVYINVGDS